MTKKPNNDIIILMEVNMAKKKSKSNVLSMAVAIVEIALVVLLFCTLAMSAIKTTWSASGVLGSGEHVQRTGLVDYLGAIFNGDETNGWAITSLIVFMLSLLDGAIIAVVSILKLSGIKVKLPSRLLEILLVVLTGLFLLTMIIYASQNGGSLVDSSIVTSEIKAIASWAPIVAFGSSIAMLVVKLFDK